MPFELIHSTTASRVPPWPLWPLQP